jgi:hypothetical protein
LLPAKPKLGEGGWKRKEMGSDFTRIQWSPPAFAVSPRATQGIASRMEGVFESQEAP